MLPNPAVEESVERFIWAPFPGRQTEFLAASEFDVFFGGAKGPGKSDCLLMGSTRQSHLERYKALLLRETFGELQDLIDRSHRIFPKLRSKPSWSGEHKRWVFPGGGIIQFKYCRTVDDVEVIAQGQEWGFIGYDEIGKLKDENVVHKLQAEIRCANPHVVWMFRAGGNPGGAAHPWLKRRYINKCGVDGSKVWVQEIRLPGLPPARITRRYIPARVTDNPVYANDPFYMAQLYTLPEVIRKQLLYGDWDAGYGSALDELDERKHFKKAFTVPANWIQFGSFDWGFAHNWVFIWFAADEDGRIWVVDTVHGRRHKVHEQAQRIHSKVPVGSLQYIHAGHDVFAKNRSRDDNTPTIAEEFIDHGIIMAGASIDRKQGLMNARHYLAWRGIGPAQEDSDPWTFFMDTPGNRWLFSQLESMVTDEDDPEDVLKVDADPITGEGGDDGYDAWRYGLASRPPRAIGAFMAGNVRAFSKESLHYEVEHKYRDRDMPNNQRPLIGSTGAFGSYGAGW